MERSLQSSLSRPGISYNLSLTKKLETVENTFISHIFMCFLFKDIRYHPWTESF